MILLIGITQRFDFYLRVESGELWLIDLHEHIRFYHGRIRETERVWPLYQYPHDRRSAGRMDYGGWKEGIKPLFE